MVELTASESILEDLLKAQELQDRKVHAWVESETTLVWSKSTVELDSETAVDLHLALVVFPCYSELDHTLWNGGDLECLLVLWVLLIELAGLEGGGELPVVCQCRVLLSLFEQLRTCMPARTQAQRRLVQRRRP